MMCVTEPGAEFQCGRCGAGGEADEAQAPRLDPVCPHRQAQV